MLVWHHDRPSNAREAIELVIEDRLGAGLPLPDALGPPTNAIPATTIPRATGRGDPASALGRSQLGNRSSSATPSPSAGVRATFIIMARKL